MQFFFPPLCCAMQFLKSSLAIKNFVVLHSVFCRFSVMSTSKSLVRATCSEDGASFISEVQRD